MIRRCNQCMEEMKSMCPCSECADKLTFCSEACAKKFLASLSPEEMTALLATDLNDLPKN